MVEVQGHRNKRQRVLVEEISGLLCRDVMIFFST